MGGLPIRSIVRAGLGGGVVTVFVAMVGLIERFSDRNLVGDQVTLGRVMLAVPPLVVSYIAMRPRIVAGRLETEAPAAHAAGGALTGLVTGSLLGAALLLVELIDVERVRNVFIAVSPTLIEIITFERGVGQGVLILVVGGALLGALGGIARSASPAVRKPITVGVSATILMGLLQRIVPIVMFELGLETDWLYSSATFGLTWFGGVAVLAVSTALSVVWSRRGPATRERLREIAGEQRSTRLVAAVVLIGLLAMLPLLLGTVISEVLGQVMIFVLLGLGLNIVVGYAGLLDLGYVAFFAFGAYTTGLLTGAFLNTTTGAVEPVLSADINFYVAVWIVALLAAGVGFLIGAPVLRLRGDYLAIVTLGLGEIVTIITASRWAQPLIGGPQGMRGVTKAQVFGLNFQDNPQHFYYLALSFVLLAVFVSWRLANSRVGRAWQAMREDEQVAEAMGISTTRFKLLAFAMGGAIGSLGGALFAVALGSLTPASFEILVSITALAVVILGGLGSLPGVVVGALVLIGLPGLLREFEEFRLLIYGGVIVAIMILRPQGLVPNVRRSRELKEEELAQDEWAHETGAEPIPIGAAQPAVADPPEGTPGS